MIMGFIQPCFIRKNTPEIRKSLEELGYRLSGAELNEDLCIFTEPEYGLYSVEFFSNIPHPDETDSVDCGTNEDLFLAIAALRDDTSNNQYWVFNEDFHKWKKGDFVIGRFERCSCYCHVATVQELIEHFKKVERT